MTPYVPTMTLPMAIYASCGAASSASENSLPCDCGTSVRISKIEIIGRNRMNRKSRKKKNPIVPM